MSSPRGEDAPSLTIRRMGGNVAVHPPSHLAVIHSGDTEKVAFASGRLAIVSIVRCAGDRVDLACGDLADVVQAALAWRQSPFRIEGEAGVGLGQ